MELDESSPYWCSGTQRSASSRRTQSKSTSREGRSSPLPWERRGPGSAGISVPRRVSATSGLVGSPGVNYSRQSGTRSNALCRCKGTPGVMTGRARMRSPRTGADRIGAACGGAGAQPIHRATGVFPLGDRGGRCPCIRLRAAIHAPLLRPPASRRASAGLAGPVRQARQVWHLARNQHTAVASVLPQLITVGHATVRAAKAQGDAGHRRSSVRRTRSPSSTPRTWWGGAVPGDRGPGPDAGRAGGRPRPLAEASASRPDGVRSSRGGCRGDCSPPSPRG